MVNQNSAYVFKVKLLDIKPIIWRRFQVPGPISLYKLHKILQVVMGWDDYHLYEFLIGQERFSESDPEYPEIKNARRIKLCNILTTVKTKLIYTYDFGDNWEHEITVEKIIPSEQELKYPICLGGKRACPPEDCGSSSGYDRLLRIIRNPSDKEYKEMMKWLGGSYDPEYFDLEKVNQSLRAIR
jgi:hypothetical protein